MWRPRPNPFLLPVLEHGDLVPLSLAAHSLTPKQRAAFVLRASGLPWAEIGKALKVNTARAHQLWKAADRALEATTRMREHALWKMDHFDWMLRQED